MAYPSMIKDVIIHESLSSPLLALTLPTRLQFFGLSVAALLAVELREVVENDGCGGVFGAEHLVTNGEGAAVERFGLGVAALITVERRKLVEAVGGVGVFGAEHVFPN